MKAENRERGADSWNPLDEPPRVTWDVARGFYPLRGVDSGLWRSSLQRMQQQFATAAQDAEKLTCVLTQSIVPEWPKRPDGPYPPEIGGLKPVGIGGGPGRGPEQLFLRRQGNEETIVSGIGRIFQENWQLRILNIGQTVKQGETEYEPIVGDRTFCDVGGNPILYSNGEPVALQPGINRSYLIYAKERPASLENFRRFSDDAGRTLYGLPVSVNRVLWRDWLDGFMTIDDGAMWVNALFELAWQHIPGSALIARKMAWNGTTSIPLDALPHLRQQAEHGAPIGGLDSITDPPAHWYSVIDDLMTASVAAIEILLSIQGTEPKTSQDTDAKGGDAGRDALETATPPSDDALPNANRADSLEACKPSVRKAYYSFKLAEALMDRRLEDREAWDLLHDSDWSEHYTDELTDYQFPPSYDTWARQLRDARKATNEQKYTPRTHK